MYAFHPQEELAKFGYRPERKVEKNINPAIFWSFFLNYYLNLANFFFKSSKFCNFGAFFVTKILCMSCNGSSFCHRSVRINSQKIKHWLEHCKGKIKGKPKVQEEARYILVSNQIASSN